MTSGQGEFASEINALEALGLPMPVYLVDTEGHFCWANAALRNTLRLPDPVPRDATLLKLYRREEDRQRIIDSVLSDEAAGRVPSPQVAEFLVDRQVRWFQIRCRSLRDDRNTVRGFLGSISDVSPAIAHRMIFDHFPAGAYWLDKEGRLLECNPAFAALFEYASPDAFRDGIANSSLQAIYAIPDQARELDEEVRTRGHVVNKTLLFESPLTGRRFYGAVTAHSVLDRRGEYAGRQGTVTDVTDAALLDQVVSGMKLGKYIVDHSGDADTIRSSNGHFAELFDLGDPSGVRGMDPRSLYQDAEDDYPRFIGELKASASAGSPLIGYHLPVRSDRRGFTLELNCAALLDARGELTGRVGLARDVTDVLALRRFRRHVAGVLHSYSSVLAQLDIELKNILRAMGADPFEERAGTDRLEEVAYVLRQAALALRSAVLRLQESDAWQAATKKSSSERTNTSLTALAEKLQSTEKRDRFPPLYARYLWSLLDEADENVKKLADLRLPREQVKRVVGCAAELRRLTCLVFVHQALDSASIMEWEARSFRKVALADEEETSGGDAAELRVVMSQAIANISPYASYEHVELRVDEVQRSLQVIGRRESLVRALANLLHNAIKYTWSRSVGERWIGVRVLAERDTVRIVVGNWGVGIPADELASDVLFDFGYRGRLASDRGRVGTGIGLADARETTRRFGGNVSISSMPASGGTADGLSDEECLARPFLTEATMILRRKREDANEAASTVDRR